MPEDEKLWRLYTRAWDILDGRRCGLGLPILRKLRRRNFPPAVIALASLEDDGYGVYRPTARSSVRRAAIGGDGMAAYCLAIDYLNRGDRSAYRRWLAIARIYGDDGAAEQIKRFPTRWPHTAMKRWHCYDGRRAR